MTKSWYLRALKNNIGIGLVILFSTFVLSFAGSYSGANPNLATIDANWRALYGSPVHDAIVVFNKMSGTTSNDFSKDSLCIMRFGMVGSTTAAIKNLMKYQQWVGVSGWGVSSCYRISPDGAKIAMQNGSAVSVCDTNGANLQVIESVSLNTDQLSLSWDDSASIRRIVYASLSGTNPIVLRRVINSNNSKGSCDTLWSHAWNRDPSVAGWGGKYTSVNKVGHYICFDMPGDANIPIVADVAAKTAQEPTNQSNANKGDGCQVRMLHDGLGTVSYHPATHLTSTNVWRWGMNKDATVFKIPCPTNAGCSDCGNNMFYWCDSDTNYMVQTGDNQASASPGCYTKAFIRKGKTSSNVMYLGDYYAFPALWINPNLPTQNINNRVTSNPGARVSIKLTATELALVNFENKAFNNAVLTNVSGAVVAVARKTAPNVQRFTVSAIPAGIYIVSWHESNSVLSRFVTIAH
jgi:hypothetical protein